VACLLAASSLVAGCLPFDEGENYARLFNNSTERFTVPIAGSDRIASAPPRSGGFLYDKDGPIADTECVGRAFSIVDSSGVVRATYDQPVCPDTTITIAEDGTISVRSGGTALTPAPDPTP
jgi:hypothetical protein